MYSNYRTIHFLLMVHTCTCSLGNCLCSLFCQGNLKSPNLMYRDFVCYVRYMYMWWYTGGIQEQSYYSFECLKVHSYNGGHQNSHCFGSIYFVCNNMTEKFCLLNACHWQLVCRSPSCLYCCSECVDILCTYYSFHHSFCHWQRQTRDFYVQCFWRCCYSYM